jgi:hypothetical protein
MDKPDPPLRPLEAFRVILRAQYRKRLALADEITDRNWFFSRQEIKGTHSADELPLRADLTVQEREEVGAAQRALKTLRASVQQGKVRLRGRLSNDLVPRDIDPQDAMDGELVIWNDMLEMGSEREPYQNVYCIAEDVRGIAGVADQYRTGAPGRPTSMHLVEQHYSERCQQKEAKRKISHEADYLAEWLRLKHPREPKLTPKAIRNKLATAHRRYVENLDILPKIKISGAI